MDTNAVHIARQLRTIGLDLHYMTTVGDNLERIAHVIDIALNRVDVVITSGGLGPTVDDVTREAVAKATGRELVFSPELLEQIRAFFKRVGRRMSENNQRQAYVPRGAVPVPNPVGSAPAFIVETDRGVVISLPGVPREMKYLLETVVLPYLKERFQLQAVIKTRLLRTVAAGESAIDAAIADLMELSNPTVGLAAHPGQTDIRITAKAATEEEADALIAPVEAEIRKRLGEVIYGVDAEQVEDVVAHLLRKRRWQVALAQVGLECHVAERLRKAGVKVRILSDSPPFPVHSENDALAWAHELRMAYHVDVLGLMVAVSEDSEEYTVMAVVAPTGEQSARLMYRAFAEYRKQWVANMILDFIRRLAMQTTS